MWFANTGYDSIGRISTTGEISTYPSTGNPTPDGITLGPDGALWFANVNGDSIGRLSRTYVDVSPASGPPGTAVTVSGGGYGGFDGTFIAAETVNVFYKTGLPSPKKVLLCSVTSSTGTFTCSGNIPNKPIAGPKGAHTIVVKGLTSLTKIKATFLRTAAV